MYQQRYKGYRSCCLHNKTSTTRDDFVHCWTPVVNFVIHSYSCRCVLILVLNHHHLTSISVILNVVSLFTFIIFRKTLYEYINMIKLSENNSHILKKLCFLTVLSSVLKCYAVFTIRLQS